jgi:hypothetical protein
MPRQKTRYYRNEDGIIGEKNEYQVRRRDTTREDRLTGMKTEKQQIIPDTRNEVSLVSMSSLVVVRLISYYCVFIPGIPSSPLLCCGFSC